MQEERGPSAFGEKGDMLVLIILLLLITFAQVGEQSVPAGHFFAPKTAVYAAGGEKVAGEDATDDIPNSYYEDVLSNIDDNGTFYDPAVGGMDDPKYRWEADVTSLLAFIENGDPSIPCGYVVNDDTYTRSIAFLGNAWDIHDRDSALRVIDETIREGNQAKYRDAIKEGIVLQAAEAIERDFGSDLSFDDTFDIDEEYFAENGIVTDEFYRVKGAAIAKLRFGDNAFMAYDFTKLMKVITVSYECGFITCEEQDAYLKYIEEKLKDEFSGFEDIHESYYYGEMFRLGEVNSYNNSIIIRVGRTIVRMGVDGYYDIIDGDY